MGLSERDLRRVAAEAVVDVRTVRRYLADGGTPRSQATKEAVDRAVEKLGIAVEKDGEHDD